MHVARFAEAGGEGVEFRLVFARGGFRVDLAAHAEDISLRNSRWVDQCLLRDAIVRVFVIGRHAPFVAERELDLAPWQIAGLIYQRRVDRPWRTAPGQAETEEPAVG